jgi:hypothetical protein
MWRLFCIIAAGMSALSASASAESIYLTTSERLEGLGLGSDYAFIAPYAVRVEMAFSASITKASNANSSNSSNSANSQSKAATPLILHGQRLTQDANGNWSAEISVSCDMSTVLQPENGVQPSITIASAVPKTYSGTFPVSQIKPDALILNYGHQDPGKDNLTKGTISDASCPPAAASDTLNVTFTVNSAATKRAYLYLRKNGWFSDSINVSTDSNGMLSSSDTSSAQQITAILTELAQTIGQALVPGAQVAFEKTPPKPNGEIAREKCFTTIANEIKSGPFYAIPTAADVKKLRNGPPWRWTIPLDVDNSVQLVFDLQPVRDDTSGTANLYDRRNLESAVDNRGRTRTYFQHDGLIGYFPVMARATASCVFTSLPNNPVLLTAPTTVNVYIESQFLDPQRDFFTSPQDTFSFNAGMIIGHKYSGQAPAKTVVDTLTAPIRALIPSVSVQQTTQVQTGGGKPDQTTVTTQTTTGASKSQ